MQANLLLAQGTAPSTAPQLPSGPLTITITGVEGMVQVRNGADQPWQKAAIGGQFAEGVEFRTGPKSAVRFNVGTDQVFTLDRFGTVKVLRATLVEGKVVTDVGMPYGRTRYDIDSTEREHDTKVRSPSSVLAVRGTKVSIYDQPPFAPQAVSLVGRAEFSDLKRTVPFGGTAKAKVTSEAGSAAKYAADQTVVDPRGNFAGNTPSDQRAMLALAADPIYLFDPIFIDTAAQQKATLQTSRIGFVPVGRQLFFNAFWIGDPFSNVDLTVTSSLGEVVSLKNPLVASGGRHAGDGVADSSGFGQEQILWEISYPPGTYKIQTDLVSGKNASVTVVVNDDPGGLGLQAVPISNVTLDPASPTASASIAAPLPSGVGTQSISKTSSLKPAKASAKPNVPAAPPLPRVQKR
jgi:hypothetical protein